MVFWSELASTSPSRARETLRKVGAPAEYSPFTGSCDTSRVGYELKNVATSRLLNLSAMDREMKEADDLHLNRSHLQKLVALVTLHLHDVVNQLDLCVLAPFDNLKGALERIKYLAKDIPYTWLEMRDLLQRRIRFPHRLHTPLREIHGP